MKYHSATIGKRVDVTSVWNIILVNGVDVSEISTQYQKKDGPRDCRLRVSLLA